MNNYTRTVKGKFLKAVNEHNMLENADNVVVGFSGGADSICLLHLLKEYSDELKFEVKAAHINHGIRGEEAERDELFAENFCNENDIPFFVLHTDCVAEAKKTGESVEECGRRLRYGFFSSLCTDNSKIATAHNANDNAETVIFNLTRGTSLKGVCGIPPVRERIIRPLILCTREEIEGYCNENGLLFVTDSTNLSCDYTRNKIRHHVIPVLCEINPNLFNSIGNFTDSVSSINDFFSNQCDNFYVEVFNDNKRISVNKLLCLKKAVAKEIIVRYFSTVSTKTLDSKKINEIYDLLIKGGRMQVFGNIYAESVKNEFRFFELSDSVDNGSIVIDLIPFSFENRFYNISVEKYENSSKKINSLLLDNLIDYDTINGNLRVRSREAGDLLTLSRRNVTKSLKKLFCEAAVPVEKRGFIPVLCDDDGIVWVYGFGVNKRCRVTDTSINIIVIGGYDNDR